MPFKNTDGSPIESIHQLGSKSFVDDCKKTSISLGEDGGDTHIHAYRDSKRIAIVTTSLSGVPGGYSDHVAVRADEPEFDPSDAAGEAFCSVMGDDSDSTDFDPSDAAGEAFRSVMGDDN